MYELSEKTRASVIKKLKVTKEYTTFKSQVYKLYLLTTKGYI